MKTYKNRESPRDLVRHILHDELEGRLVLTTAVDDPITAHWGARIAEAIIERDVKFFSECAQMLQAVRDWETAGNPLFIHHKLEDLEWVAIAHSKELTPEGFSQRRVVLGAADYWRRFAGMPLTRRALRALASEHPEFRGMPEGTLRRRVDDLVADLKIKVVSGKRGRPSGKSAMRENTMLYLAGVSLDRFRSLKK